MRRKLTILLVCPALFISLSAYSGGYQVRLQGQKQTGIALIGTPFAYDASSIFYNPGALAMIKQKYNFSGGVSTIFSNHVFRKESTDYEARTDNPMGTPFYFYGSTKITDNLSVGFGVYTPFGSSAKWDNDWAGKYLIRNISLMAIFYQPTLSYKVSEWLSVGAGFIYATGNVKLEKALPYNDAPAELEGSTGSIGYNAGVYLKPFNGLSLGVSYRSEIKMEVEDGEANFDVPESLESTIPRKNKFDATLPMPANLDFGISYDVNDKLTLAVEVNWVMWDIYDTLSFKFEKAGDLLNSDNPRLYKDSWITRVGGQYKLNDKIVLRAGAYYDPSPTNKNYFNPETVSLNTIAWTLGMTVTPVKNLDIDLSYLQLHGEESEKSYEPANFSGIYKTITIIPGIGVSYSF